MEVWLLGFGLALLPIYTFESGTVQFAHVFLLLFALSRFTHQSLSLTTAEICLVVLTLLSFAVESLAVIIASASIGSLLHSAYLAFNTSIVIALSRIPLGAKSFRFALIGSLAVGITIAAVSALYYGASFTLTRSGLERSVGLFNNPNQQGYYGVCVASIAGLLYLRGILSRKVCLFYWGMAMIVVLVSVSRAASVAMIVLLVFGGAALLNKRLSTTVLMTSFALLALLWLAYSAGALDYFQFIERIKNTGAHRYDSWAARGYFFPSKGAIDFLFGVGSENARMADMFNPVEVHSTWWSFMGKYGILGFGLIMAVSILWARAIYKQHGVLGLLIVVLPHVIVGLTGNYSRFAPFWIVVGLSLNRVPMTAWTDRRERIFGRPFHGVDISSARGGGATLGGHSSAAGS